MIATHYLLSLNKSVIRQYTVLWELNNRALVTGLKYYNNVLKSGYLTCKKRISVVTVYGK